MHQIAPQRIASVRIVLQPEQRLALAPETDGHLYVLTTGLALLEARIWGRRRRVLELLMPGDVLTTRDVPPGIDTAVTAGTATCLARYRLGLAEATVETDAVFARQVHLGLAARSIRRSLHLARVCEQDAEARLADFLIETGLAIGRVTTAGRVVDLPFSREQIASHLALNPDTLSRLLTRLKARGTIDVAQRRIVIRDWNGLCGSSPVAVARTELAAHRPS